MEWSLDEKREVCASVRCGHFSDVIRRPLALRLIRNSLKCVWDGGVHDLVNGDCEDTLAVAIACLQMFVEINWTGPVSAITEDELLRLLSLDNEEYTETHAIIAGLSIDGESIYERVVSPLLLAVARHLLKHGYQTESKPQAWLIWQLRSVAIHQSMIVERCESLKTECMLCVQQLLALEETSQHNHSATDAADLYMGWRVEAASQCRFYFEHKMCKKLLKEAELKSQLNIALDGVKGKRTRYQEKTLAQLILTVQRQANGTAAGDVDSQSEVKGLFDALSLYPCHSKDESEPVVVPKNELLQDDTVLEDIQLSDTPSVTKLNWIEHCLVLALCEENMYVRANNSEITDEETGAYLRYVLSARSDWSVQCKALLMRSLVEKQSARRVERSLRQLEELSSLSSKPEPSVCMRLQGVYTSNLPPVWQLQRTLGELQMEIGAYASAMEIFDRLALYDPLIVCSQRSGRLGKAEELIKDRLSVKESAPLYCSLADVTGDIQHYHKAWQFSNNRSARAMRGLAFHHLRACQYEDANKCFEQTLAINPLQLSCWFSFGCSSLAAGIYDKAATAFRRCVMLNEDNFEAWNNLAAAYARNKQKDRAFAVLQDAVKCNFDNWKIWENYAVLGADCAQIAEVIRGAHRILELTGKWKDDQVVEHLTRFVIQNIEDANGRPSSCHREELLKLFGHATSKVTNSSVLWRSYGRVILDSKDNSTDNMERGIQCLQKAYRCSINNANWEKSEDQCTVCTEILFELVDAYILLASKKYMGTARIQLKSHISRLTKQHTDPVSQLINSEHIQALLKSLNDCLLNLPVPV